MAITGEGDWTQSWPWPQVFVNEYYVVGVTKDKEICELSPSGNNWVSTQIGTLDTLEHLAFLDYKKCYVLCNSGGGVIRNPGIAAGDSGELTEIPNANIPVFCCGCDFRGQAVIGNIVNNDEDATYCDLNEYSIAWSEIGQLNFNISEKRTAGQMQLGIIPWGMGVVGNRVIVIGEYSVKLLVPHSLEASGFGQMDLYGPGAKSKGAIGIGNDEVCWIDKRNNLWYYALGMDKPEKLGFSEFLDFTSVKISCLNGRFYIANYNNSYVLYKGRLFDSKYIVSSVGTYRDLSVYFGSEVSGNNTLTISNVLFNSLGIKTHEGVETDFEGTLQIGSSDIGPYVQSQVTSLGYNGTKFAARRFRYSLIGNTESFEEFSKFIVKIKHCDRNAVRGARVAY